jgi:hypothetical protein
MVKKFQVVKKEVQEINIIMIIVMTQLKKVSQVSDSEKLLPTI